MGQQLTIPRAKDAPHTFSDEDRAQGQDPLRGLGEEERRQLLAWEGENLPCVRRSPKRRSIARLTAEVPTNQPRSTRTGHRR